MNNIFGKCWNECHSLACDKSGNTSPDNKWATYASRPIKPSKQKCPFSSGSSARRPCLLPSTPPPKPKTSTPCKSPSLS